MLRVLDLRNTLLALTAVVSLTSAAGCGVAYESGETVVLERTNNDGNDGEAEVAVEAEEEAAEIALPGRTDGCPDGMVRVEGEYCPEAIQQCLEHHPEWVKNQGAPGVAERCLHYAESRCLSKKKVHLSFCMDRYEYPNEKGAIPQMLTSWQQATATCKSQGKRLCTEPEFDFACEG